MVMKGLSSLNEKEMGGNEDEGLSGEMLING